jgi:hypothetical protein
MWQYLYLSSTGAHGLVWMYQLPSYRTRPGCSHVPLSTSCYSCLQQFVNWPSRLECGWWISTDVCLLSQISNFQMFNHTFSYHRYGLLLHISCPSANLITFMRTEFNSVHCLCHSRSCDHLLFFYPKDGGSCFLWNIGKHLQDYTVLCPRSQWSAKPPDLWTGQNLFIVKNCLFLFLMNSARFS